MERDDVLAHRSIIFLALCRIWGSLHALKYANLLLMCMFRYIYFFFLQELREIASTEAVKGKHFFLEVDIKGPSLKLDNTGKGILTVSFSLYVYLAWLEVILVLMAKLSPTTVVYATWYYQWCRLKNWFWGDSLLLVVSHGTNATSVFTIKYIHVVMIDIKVFSFFKRKPRTEHLHQHSFGIVKNKRLNHQVVLQKAK